jgi:membrane-associated phospholipid phosphatase
MSERTNRSPKPIDLAAATKPSSRAVRLATRTILVGLVTVVGTLLLLAFIADGIREQEAFALDTWATPFLHSISSPGLDAVMLGLTTMGSSVVVVPIFVVTSVWLLFRKVYGAILFLGVSLGGALVIDATMKLLFERPRPKLDYASVLPDYSFPSGHSMNGVVFYVGLALVLWSLFGRRAGLPATIAAAVLALGIGVSRIYLGFHYFTDVIGGFLAGIGWLLVVAYAFRVTPDVWPWRAPSVGETPAEVRRG